MPSSSQRRLDQQGSYFKFYPAAGLMQVLLLILLLGTGLFLAGCGGKTQNDPLLVSAAASLQPVLMALEPEIEKSLDIEIVYNFGSSGKLAQQIEQGAPVDVFLSANRAYVDELTPDGHLIADSITPFACGRLVVWTKTADLTALADLTRSEVRRIAMANPDHAPYGAAARQALQSAGLWEAVSPKLVFGENVTQSYQFAQRGDVDAAFVSASQVIAQDGRQFDVSDALYPPLVQTAALVAQSQKDDAARAFIRFLLSPAAQTTFRNYGYLSPCEETS